MDAIGEQRRGERVALDADVGPIVEAEGGSLRLAETTGAGNAEGGVHFEAPGSFAGFGSPAL